MEVLFAAFDRCRVLLVAREVGVDELDEAVEVLGRHLWEVISLETLDLSQVSKVALTDSLR